MNDTWVLITDAVCVEHGTVEEMTDAYGGDFDPGDEHRMASRVFQAGDSDGAVLYGTREDLAAFGRRLVEWYG